MKKIKEFLFYAIITIAVISFIIVGIIFSDKADRYRKEHPETRTLNGCQYYINDVRGSEVLVHRGDCNNPIHNKQ